MYICRLVLKFRVVLRLEFPAAVMPYQLTDFSFFSSCSMDFKNGLRQTEDCEELFLILKERVSNVDYILWSSVLRRCLSTLHRFQAVVTDSVEEPLKHLHTVCFSLK